MWLLSTDRAELHYFVSAEVVPGGYAILSHVWTNDETQFYDIRAVETRCKETGENPRDFVSSKIREFCILSAKHGYTFAWADTCCIDKSSSAELSEAINSMFHYYSLAGVCYAYLSDVAAKDGKLDHSAFYKSRWHTRGWTLQELLAPRLLLFLSRDWEVLGSKAELAEPLGSATAIPLSILRFEEEIQDVSIAQRMSWASRRVTTRIEDEAYCLMGIFDINMPMLYGEGRKAFQRLQEEIMRTSTDTSLFAWGRFTNSYNLAPRNEEHDHFSPSSYLLAPSPGSFVDSHSVKFEPHADFPVKQRAITFSITPSGVLAHIPILVLRNYTIAFLSCADPILGPLGLFITSCPFAADRARPPFHTSINTVDYPCRLLSLAAEVLHPLRALLGLSSASKGWEWANVLFAHPIPLNTEAPRRALTQLNASLAAPFRMPDASLHACGAEGTRLVSIRRSGDVVGLQFEYRKTRPPALEVIVRLGLCLQGRDRRGTGTTSAAGPSASNCHWATLHFLSDGSLEDILEKSLEKHKHKSAESRVRRDARNITGNLQ
ncbi:HET-domain-containing protein [Epithele typhae]|uniref:HET-domain-containing protein n=1 Tax=Epithele typhae TaxID=378194 RepID=UPI00200871E8|nr:HET-domain-containing protein [Epithele typhae]KAH9910404.1 HET-domain-containing protein [Epithele typhae]